MVFENESVKSCCVNTSLCRVCFEIYFLYLEPEQNQNRLRSTVQSTDVVTILRGNDVEEKISSEDLVPGDLVVIPPSGCELNFDGVLISGTAIGNSSCFSS
jgi:magnesium-transporting ATPase (P-type)